MERFYLLVSTNMDDCYTAADVSEGGPLAIARAIYASEVPATDAGPWTLLECFPVLSGGEAREFTSTELYARPCP
jgi:hypothetical protein